MNASTICVAPSTMLHTAMISTSARIVGPGQNSAMTPAISDTTPWAMCQSSRASVIAPWNSSSRPRSGRRSWSSAWPCAIAANTGVALAKSPQVTATARLADGAKA